MDFSHKEDVMAKKTPKKAKPAPKPTPKKK